MATREELARELAHRNGRCGHSNGDYVCLRPANHDGEHKFESINQVIPFVNQ